jgi:hypothetical protein
LLLSILNRCFLEEVTSPINRSIFNTGQTKPNRQSLQGKDQQWRPITGWLELPCADDVRYCWKPESFTVVVKETGIYSIFHGF